MHRWRRLAAAAVILGATTLASGGPAAGQVLVFMTARGPTHGFTISGTAVTGLYPGATRRIDLTFSNPYLTPIRVRSVAGRLISTSKRGCRSTPANLEVRGYTGRLPATVPPRSRQNAGHLDVHMPNSVSDACQNATFTVQFTGEATEAGR